MREAIYQRSGEEFIIEELTGDEFFRAAKEIAEYTDCTDKFDGVVYIEYEDGSVCYYSDSDQSGDLRSDGIVCGVITNSATQQVVGEYFVDAYGVAQVFDARSSLEAYAEACADSQTELDMVLARIAEDFAGRQTYAEAFTSAVQREMADWSGHMVLHDAAESVIGKVVARAKERANDGETVSFRIYSFVGTGEYCPDPDSELLMADVAHFASARTVAESREFADSARKRCEARNIADSDYCSYSIVIAEVDGDGYDYEVCSYEHTL